MNITEIEKNLDKVVVTYRDFKKISEFFKNKLEPDKNLISPYLDMRHFFPLKNFILDLEVKKNYKRKFLVELDSFNPTTGGRITDADFWLTYKREPDNQRSWIDGKGAPKDILETTHIIIVSVLMYICMQSRERIAKERKEGTPKERKTDHIYQYRDRECFLFDQIIEYTKEHPNRKSIQYQCECWGVRGHIRHMTDGSVQFVHPYKKGRKRDVLEPKSKTYLLTREVSDDEGNDTP